MFCRNGDEEGEIHAFSSFIIGIMSIDMMSPVAAPITAVFPLGLKSRVKTGFESRSSLPRILPELRERILASLLPEPHAASMVALSALLNLAQYTAQVSLFSGVFVHS